MADARIATSAFPFIKGQTTSVASTYTPYGPTSTKPTTGGTGNGIVIYDSAATSTAFNISPNYAAVAAPSLFTLVPFTTVNSGTYGMRVTKFNSYRNASDSATWWIPTTVFDGSIVLSTTQANIPTFGASNPDGTQLYLFSGITSNGSAPTANLYSPASILATTTLSASITLDPVGAQLLVVQFTASANTPTMGVFWTAT
jgi:hypothetical protein